MNYSLEKLFLPLAFLFGLSLVFLIPPFQSPDEPNHFLKAYHLSAGHFFPEKTVDARLGGLLPSSLATFEQQFSFLKNNYTARCDVAKIQEASHQNLRPDVVQFNDFANTAIYAPTAYLPQAFVLFFAKKMNFSPLVLLYLCRIANLLLWIGLVYNALKKLPFGKKIGAFLALLPASLTIAASCNADVLTNGLAFWVFAFFLQIVSQKTKATSLFTPCIALCIIALNKIVFAPLALLAFLPFLKKNADSKTQKPYIIQAVGITALVFALSLAWAYCSNENFIPYDQYNPDYRQSQTLNEGVHPSAQLDFILAEPLFFIQTSIVSYLDALPSTAAHIVGKFGWEKNYLPAWILGLLWAGLLGLLYFEKTSLSKTQRLLLLAIAVLCAALFSITMYCLWMPVGSPVLGNLQGRYFVPVLPLVFFSFLGKKAVVDPAAKKTTKSSPYVDVGLLGIVLVGHLGLLVAVLYRYWF